MRVFNELQRFDQWWFRGILLFAFVSLVGALVMAFPETNSDEVVFWVLISVGVLAMSTMILIAFFMQLETKIDEQGIHYAFKPFHRSFRHILWYDIRECYVRKYSPIGEYGGWGYRVTLGKKGKALNVKGNLGIQVVLKNDKRLLLGTQKEDEAKRVVATYAHKL